MYRDLATAKSPDLWGQTFRPEPVDELERPWPAFQSIHDVVLEPSLDLLVNLLIQAADSDRRGLIGLEVAHQLESRNADGGRGAVRSRAARAKHSPHSGTEAIGRGYDLGLAGKAAVQLGPKAG